MIGLRPSRWNIVKIAPTKNCAISQPWSCLEPERRRRVGGNRREAPVCRCEAPYLQGARKLSGSKKRQTGPCSGGLSRPLLMNRRRSASAFVGPRRCAKTWAQRPILVARLRQSRDLKAGARAHLLACFLASIALVLSARPLGFAGAFATLCPAAIFAWALTPNLAEAAFFPVVALPCAFLPGLWCALSDPCASPVSARAIRCR